MAEFTISTTLQGRYDLSMRRIQWLLLSVLLVACAGARGQTFFLPVQYQYGVGANLFYYGGSDPGVIQRAMRPSEISSGWGRVNGFAFVSADVRVHREVVNEPLRIFSDAVPLQNARLFGYTAQDAANEANASVPRYFRKADVIRPSRQRTEQ